jgi:hypothetical protein
MSCCSAGEAARRAGLTGAPDSGQGGPISGGRANPPWTVPRRPAACRRMTGASYRGERTVEQGRCCTRSPRSRDDVNHVQPRRPSRWWVILALHHPDDLVAFLGNKHGPVRPDDGVPPLVAGPFSGPRTELTVKEEALVLKRARQDSRYAEATAAVSSGVAGRAFTGPAWPTRSHWRPNFSVPPITISRHELQAP